MIKIVNHLWQTSKVLVVSLLVYICAVAMVLISTATGYLSLKKVMGNIVAVSLDKSKATILKFNIAGANTIYYQKYERRFSDENSVTIKKGDNIYFYTFQSPERKRAAISSLGDQSAFFYYPVFYINQAPGIWQVFLYRFYNSLILTILISLSWALILYNGFSVALKSNIVIKFMLGILSIGMLWLVI
ncbi:hypothetical protein [Mucilaginibacter glaciei]|uniref:Uncharacterized protein n=1 Tax=Mucilaginibacter glaciei TaxID=2772109 RepID=A0A926S048_9SPHI|nr:hypothetical protein [Mucilaginibacter glaciei]MBD1391658.1 hypothetical protein [Mucilaginibacter glaciei]